MERQNRSTTDAIRATLLQDENGQPLTHPELWPDILQAAASSFRSRRQESTKYSPYELVFGEIMRLPVALRANPDPHINEDFTSAVHDYSTAELEEMEAITTWEGQKAVMEHLQDIKTQLFGEVKENIAKAQEKQKRNYNKKHLGHAIPVGTKVWRKIMVNLHRMGGKMVKKWDGPFIITEVTEKNTHQLKNCATEKIYGHKVPAVQLKLYRGRHDDHVLHTDSDEEGLYGSSVPVSDVTTEITTENGKTGEEEVEEKEEEEGEGEGEKEHGKKEPEHFVPDTQDQPIEVDLTDDSVPETQMPELPRLPELTQTTTTKQPEEIKTKTKFLKKWKETTTFQRHFPDVHKFLKIMDAEEEIDFPVKRPPVSTMGEEDLQSAITTIQQANEEEKNEVLWKYISFGVEKGSQVNILATLADQHLIKGLVFGVLEKKQEEAVTTGPKFKAPSKKTEKKQEEALTTETLTGPKFKAPSKKTLEDLQAGNITETQMTKEASECISPKIQNPTKKRRLGSRMRTVVVPPSSADKYKDKLNKWNKSAFTMHQKISTLVSNMSTLVPSPAPVVSTPCTRQKPVLTSPIAPAALAFHLNEVTPDSEAPAYNDVTLATEDEATTKMMQNKEEVVRIPLTFYPLSYPMRKAGSEMMSIPFRRAVGEVPWINIGEVLDGSPLTKAIGGDGNCYFHCISWVLTGNENHYKVIRRKVCNYIGDENNFPKIEKHILPFHRKKTINTRKVGIPAGMLYLTPGTC